MGISKIIDNKNKPASKNETIKCRKNINDCMFMKNSNTKECSAEWCIFEELPKMLSEEKIIKCAICDKDKKVSIYNNETNYICDECKEKIKELMRNERSE